MGRNNADFNDAKDGVHSAEKAWLGGKITDDEAYEAVTRKKSGPLTVKQDSVTKTWKAE